MWRWWRHLDRERWGGADRVATPKPRHRGMYCERGRTRAEQNPDKPTSPHNRLVAVGDGDHFSVVGDADAGAGVAMTGGIAVELGATAVPVDVAPPVWSSVIHCSSVLRASFANTT
jgi:hypothetical protein